MGILGDFLEELLSTGENYIDDVQSLDDMENDIKKDNDSKKENTTISN